MEKYQDDKTLFNIIDIFFSKNVFTSVDITYKRKMPLINLSHVFMLNLLAKARNSRKFRGEGRVQLKGRKKLEGGVRS